MSDQAQLLDRMAVHYRCRPSDWVHIEDDLLAYQFDLAIMVRGIQWNREQQEREADRGNPQAAWNKLRENAVPD